MSLPEEQVLADLQKELEELKQLDNNVQAQTQPQGQDQPQEEPKAEGETTLQGQQQDDAYLKKLEELKQAILAQKQEKEEPKEEPKQDDTLERLLRMTPQERAEWAAQHGQEGVLKLLELQDTLYRKELARLEFEAKTSVHDSIVDDWAARNEDIFQDKEMAAIAQGIEKALLEEAGVQSYKELSPAQLRKHLKQTEEKVRAIAEKLGKVSKKEDKKEGEKETALGAFRSVGDVSGGVTDSGSDLVDVTKLSGFDLESLPMEKLQQLEQKLLQ
jgi:molybdopterin converting factor small subunit